EWSHGASYATFDNLTMGLFGGYTQLTGTEPIFTELGIDGAQFVDWKFMQFTIAETALGTALLFEGGKTAGQGLLLIPASGGGSMILVIPGIGVMTIGAGLDAHASLMYNNLNNKDYKQASSSESGSG